MKNDQLSFDYQIKQKLEVGNYATVYRIRDKDNQDLVLKIARDNIPEFNNLIGREFQILSQFKHPNIVQVYDYGITRDNISYFTMEYIKGKPIDRHFQRFSQEFVRAILQVLNGISAFHKHGFIHCDLKPEHIIYNPVEKRCVIIDFGFAGISSQRIKEYGTFGYIAPEILKGIGIDQRSDLYSLGIVIYEILSGKRPQMRYQPILDIPELLNETLNRLLVEEPALRPTALELYNIFSQYLPEEKIQRPTYEVRLPPTSFIGNKEIVDKLLGTKGETIIINGDQGSGKSRLLKELRYKFLFKDYSVLFFIGTKEGYFHNAVCDFIGFKDLNFRDKEDRFQIYAIITERLLEFARDKNLVIMVDDLDELNDYELGLFRYIGHSLKQTSVLMLGTNKPDPRIKDLNFFELFLQPFSASEVQQLLEKTFFHIELRGDSDLSSFARWLHKHSGGNPLFVVEILKTLHQQKILSYAINKWEIDIDSLMKTKVPEKLEEIVSFRLKGLNFDELYLLKILCLCDCPLEFSVLKKLAPETVNINLEVLKILGLIKEEHIQSTRVFSIANQIIRIIIEQAIKSEEKPLITEKIIEAIETNTPIKREFYPLLAGLYASLNRNSESYKYLLLSAQDAELIQNFKEAITYYRSILDYGRELDPANYEKNILKMADLYFAGGDNKNAIEYYKKVINSSDNEIKTKAVLGLGKVCAVTGDYNQALELFTGALALAKGRESADYLGITNWLGFAYTNMNDFESAEKVFNQALTTARKTKDLLAESETLYYVAILAWHKNEFEKGKQICQKLLKFCEEHNLEKQYVYGVNLLSSFYMLTNDVDNGLKYIDLAIKGFERIRDSRALVSALNNQAILLSQNADFTDALQVFEKSLIISVRIGDRKNEEIALMSIGSIYEETGRFEKALEFYQKAIKIEPDSIYANDNQAMVYCKLGEFDKAEQILETKMKNKNKTLYHIGMAMVYNGLGKYDIAQESMKNGLALMESEKFELSMMTDIFLRASQFYYEVGDFASTLEYAEYLQKFSNNRGYASILAGALIEVSRFRMRKKDQIEIETHLKTLKEKGALYDYAYLKRIKIESEIDRGILPDKIRTIAEELQSIEQVFKAMSANLELKMVERLKSRLFPEIIQDYSRRIISTQYLETFSGLAELISAHLGKEDFIESVLDLVVSATNAERGAIFFWTGENMEFIAGRNIDKKTIKDAGELSKTAIEEISKSEIVFVPNALDDPRFNVRKSILLNQIRSILCIPLIIGDNTIGAIYLDSRIIGSMFGEQDRDFLITTAKILSSVIEKSIALKRLVEEVSDLRDSVIKGIGKGYLLGGSKKIKGIHQMIESIGPTDSPVVILGETGVGKGMIARLIHQKSKRRDKKFVSINCGTIPETLLESELFGYKRGAFTGAVADKKGLLEEGEAGTVFLDEITNTSPAFQAKILEAIEEKVIRRLGETQTRNINVRFLFATNKELDIEVEQGRFRKDLYFRINIFSIRVPSLRERIEDIPALAKFFLKLKCEELNKQIIGFGPGVLEAFKQYPWPGNIRELQNVIERAAVLARTNTITLKDAGPVFSKEKDGPISLKDLTREAIIETLQSTNWSIKESARILGISRRTVERYIKKYSIKKNR